MKTFGDPFALPFSSWQHKGLPGVFEELRNVIIYLKVARNIYKKGVLTKSWETMQIIRARKTNLTFQAFKVSPEALVI